MRAYILTIGDEILIGQITDTNSAWMAQQLNAAGIEIAGKTSVGDTLVDIVEALSMAAKHADLILTTGGLGPTKDDITKTALAQYFNVPLVFSPPAYDHLFAFFAQYGRIPSELHRQQCYLPKGVELLHNAKGTAPGMWMEHDEKIFVAMPGVPHEMKSIMQQVLLPRLHDFYPALSIAHRTLLTASIGESNLAERIATFEDALPASLKLAYLPSIGKVRLRLTGIEETGKNILPLIEQKTAELADLVADHLYGFEDDTLEHAVGRLLLQRRATLAAAESCTGGSLMARVVSVAGASAYFLGGVVAYHNHLKIQHLHVSPETLAAHGAVSEPTVRQMAAGALSVFAANYAVAISGIAGPDGGTPEKPVGTIWVAVADAQRTVTRRLQGNTDRTNNIERTTVFALHLLYKFLTNRV